MLVSQNEQLFWLSAPLPSISTWVDKMVVISWWEPQSHQRALVLHLVGVVIGEEQPRNLHDVLIGYQRNRCRTPFFKDAETVLRRKGMRRTDSNSGDEQLHYFE